MRGDFSRIRFNRRKGYTAVLEQQGRVALDADANEQCFTDDYLRRTESIDVIGEYGGPSGDAGFAISIENGEIQIGTGRYYVDGLLCENDTPLAYDDQPYLLDPSPSGADLLTALRSAVVGSVVQVYLEVWQRFVTGLDDPCLREPALGHADTTGRVQTVWRVVAQAVESITPTSAGTGPIAELSPCCQVMYDALDVASTGMLSAATTGSAADCGCQPVASAGYQGVENQLYRIEIHTGGLDTEATFTWSRENGSVVAAVSDITGSTITVGSLGPDANLGFASGQWVELSDDTNVFGQQPNQPGSLYQIQSVQPTDPSVTVAGTVAAVDPGRNARLRRWDQSGPSAGTAGIPVAAGTWIELENGIQVSFTPGRYRTGDYWTIPARTATGTIEWPPCGGDGNAYQPPTSIVVRRAPLACIHWDRGILERSATERAVRPPFRPPRPPIRLGRFVVDDCRLLFEPLTQITAPDTPQAMHVERVSWVNDDVTTLDQLVASGLTVTLDQAPVSPITGAEFVVTLETIISPRQDAAVNAVRPEAFIVPREQLLPETLLRTVTVLDSQITVQGATVSWQMPDDAENFFQRLTIADVQRLLLVAATAGLWGRVRIRLLGQAIFATGASGALFLDGRAFGQLATRADGTTPRIDLQLPSGDGGRASDLEGWFSLAPAVQVTSLTVAFASLTVIIDANNNVTGVEATGTTGPVSPTATVQLNYPVISQTTVTLTLTGSSGVGTVASIPPSVSVAAGGESVTFPITILSNPGAQVTLTFDITASVALAIGSSSSASASFTVTGVAPLIQ